MEKKVNIWKILKNDKKLTKVLVFPAQETVVDPYEKNKSLSMGQYLTIEALVRDVSVSALTWKYYGQMPIGSKEIICQKKYKTTMLASDKIQIGTDEYKVRKDDSKGFAILERMDYIVIIVELKIDG